MKGLKFVRCVVTGHCCSFAALGIIAESGKLQCAYVSTFLSTSRPRKEQGLFGPLRLSDSLQV